MARGHRLNTSIVLVAVHGLSGLFRAVSAVEPSLSRPLPTLSLCLISNLASVDVKQYGQGQVMCTQNRPLSLTPRSRSDYQPIRVDYKVLQLLQPGRADTDFVCTEI